MIYSSQPTWFKLLTHEALSKEWFHSHHHGLEKIHQNAMRVRVQLPTPSFQLTKNNMNWHLIDTTTKKCLQGNQVFGNSKKLDSAML